MRASDSVGAVQWNGAVTVGDDMRGGHRARVLRHGIEGMGAGGERARRTARQSPWTRCAAPPRNTTMGGGARDGRRRRSSRSRSSQPLVPLGSRRISDQRGEDLGLLSKPRSLEPCSGAVRASRPPRKPLLRPRRQARSQCLHGAVPSRASSRSATRTISPPPTPDVRSRLNA